MKKLLWVRIAFVAILLGFAAGCATDQPGYKEAPTFPGG